MMRSQNMNPLLMSTSKPNFGRTPVQSSTRRGSMWAGGAQGNAASTGQGTKDTRPLRERSYQVKMRQDIVDWCRANELDVSPQILQNITAKDFRVIFEQLVQCLDPDWQFDPHKNLGDQLMQSLRSLHYPYVGSLDLKWLSAPGAPYSWPSLLGMLHWLAELGRAKREYLDSGDPTLQDPEQVPVAFEDDGALAFEHYVSTYEAFLLGADVYPEQERIIEERYAKKDEQAISDLQSLKEKLTKVEAELETLKKAPPPVKQLEENNGYLTRDKIKFEECIHVYEDRKQRLENAIAITNDEIEHMAKTTDDLNAEQSRLASIVKVQNLSPEEVLRMNTEHETLSNDLRILKTKVLESSKTINKLEVSLGKKTADAEEAIDTYNGLLTTLELFPPLPPPLEDVNLALRMNSAASDLRQLLVGPDIAEVVKPSLALIADQKRQQRAEVENDRIAVDNDLDQLVTACENMEEEVLDVLKKATTLNDQADELREMVQREALASNAEAERLEEALAQARAAAKAHGVGVKARLQALQIAYKEQVAKVNRLRDDTVREIIKNSSEIVMFKEEISKQLKHLRDFAEAN
ncbi:HEC/Ndc80p family-domain-containing protein [Phanerochaete sordida]|uniref:Kinetochore protein NDC80 n=1 Tax=Phanerochaete sordida TaxID=48140 RepID=A0A9P3G0R3_9APHY|nr:HEC/Ndc80p family-domain-containing protein [Phanerochaete sordida]